MPEFIELQYIYKPHCYQVIWISLDSWLLAVTGSFITILITNINSQIIHYCVCACVRVHTCVCVCNRMAAKGLKRLKNMRGPTEDRTGRWGASAIVKY